jgi:NAD(P)-dependent dehydrogenase (short-subunit alcohol dehydrogenase family)
MNLELKGKVVLVTGGARGIGAGITRAFAAEEAQVVILGRNPDEADKLIREAAASNQKVAHIFTELTDSQALKRAVEETVSRWGRIDVVVNNAGVNDAVKISDPVEKFEASLRKNLVHVFALVHFAHPHLRESRGNVINIGSKTPMTGQGGTSGYAAAKGGMNGLTREWAVDFLKDGIRVNCVVPAEVITPQYEKWLSKAPDPSDALRRLNETIPLGRRTTTIREIVDMTVFLASERSSHTTGQIIYVDGGYVHLDRAATTQVTHLNPQDH